MSALPSSPILVVSPALRAGTALVQRLLCPAPSTLIHGDLVWQEMEFFDKFCSSKEQMLRLQEGQIAPVRTAVLAGRTDDFITPLAPTLACYTNSLRDAALTWPGGGAEEAALGDTTITLAPHREAS